MKPILIYMDTRESSSGILEYFGQFNCNVEKKMLPYGDYVLSDRVVIERKTSEDFVQSIVDGRLFTQAKSMKDAFERPVFIIEGYGNLYERLHPNTVRGALGSIAIDYAIPIIFTKDLAESAGLIFWIAKREQIDKSREVPLRTKQTKLTETEQQEFLVSGLPGISVVRARALLKQFETPLNVFTADEEALKKTEGIGPKIAKIIKEILSKKYK